MTSAGGALSFQDGVKLKPFAGMAVLFPHDTPHAAEAVLAGRKYVMRSELMFRSVDRAPPPREPRFAEAARLESRSGEEWGKDVDFEEI